MCRVLVLNRYISADYIDKLYSLVAIISNIAYWKLNINNIAYSDDDDASPHAKRGRGRPSLGKPILVRLNEEESEIARQMGKGIVSEGVRMALRASKVAGLELALRMAALYGHQFQADACGQPNWVNESVAPADMDATHVASALTERIKQKKGDHHE